MNSATQRFLIPGPAGALEAALDLPAKDVAIQGLSVVAHPHPLFGGTLDNKVAQTIARAFVNQGMICLRPNFRGVGKSESIHDHGQGEVEDLWAAWDWLLSHYPDVGGKRWMGGFSFGAVMTTHIAHEWPQHPITQDQPELSRVILVGLGIADERRAPAPLTAAARLIHGEEDEVVSLKKVLDWVAPQQHPVLVMPAASHFFHAKLPFLRDCITRCLLA
ncbi:CocE/NonD family hydrolase [beta proteobacterium MWH-UniP1]